MLRPIIHSALALTLSCALFGCAEFNRRGGLVDQLEDNFLFRADTKSHRLLRSYVVLGALIAVGRNVGVPEADRAALGGSFMQALSYVDDAYQCVYPGRKRSADIVLTNLFPLDVPFTHCVFFDERMTRLDYAIYKMGVTILIDPESRKFLADVRDQLAGEIPVVGPALRAVTRANETVHEAATATQQATTLVNNLLRFSFQSLGRAAYLLPIYRDAMELDMHVVLDTLWSNCKPSWTKYLEKRKKAFLETDPVPEQLESAAEGACRAYDYGSVIFNRGDGAIDLWREFIVSLNGNVQMVDAYPVHFALVTRWLYKACVELFGTVDKDDKKKKPDVCGAVADKQTADVILARNDPKGNVVRIQARQPTTSPKFVTPPQPDPAPTGTVTPLR